MWYDPERRAFTGKETIYPNRFIVRNNSRDVYMASASLQLPARGWKRRDSSERIGVRNKRVYRQFVHRHFLFFLFVTIRSLQVVSYVPVHARVKRIRSTR